MSRTLVVITGAGASYDCSSNHVVVRDDFRPPLVVQLFAGLPRYAEILHEYPLAEAAAADIRPALASGSVAVEQFLRERLRESDDTYAQRRYRWVPLYLQHLLHAISRTNGTGFTQHPDHYDTLVNAALELDEAVFITLNYDTLLDERLFNQTLPVSATVPSMDDYAPPGPQLVAHQAPRFGELGSSCSAEDRCHLHNEPL